jgi:hypothetical protein
MRTIITLTFALFLQIKSFAQQPFIAVGSGVSNVSSSFEDRYANFYNFNIKAGYEFQISDFEILASIGYFNIKSKILGIDKILNINTIRLSSGIGYQFTPDWLLSSRFNLGVFTKKSLRIFAPRYNYDFDQFDLSYSVEISKKLNINDCRCLSLGLEFSKSLDGIIDNNFWQKDNLKPYYLNFNIYYHFKSK